MTCKEIMTANPTTCTATTHAQAVALIMSEEDVGVVPVIDEKSKRLVGLVTDRDLCLEVVAEGKSPQEVRVSAVMKSPASDVSGRGRPSTVPRSDEGASTSGIRLVF